MDRRVDFLMIMIDLYAFPFSLVIVLFFFVAGVVVVFGFFLDSDFGFTDSRFGCFVLGVSVQEIS